MTIYNRVDCCSDRLEGAMISLFSSDGTQVVVERSIGAVQQKMTLDFSDSSNMLFLFYLSVLSVVIGPFLRYVLSYPGHHFAPSDTSLRMKDEKTGPEFLNVEFAQRKIQGEISSLQ